MLVTAVALDFLLVLAFLYFNRKKKIGRFNRVQKVKLPLFHSQAKASARVGTADLLNHLHSSHIKNATIATDNAQGSINLGLLLDVYRKSLNDQKVHMEFKFQDLGLVLPNSKIVLPGLTGTIPSCQMTAIMGPTGCGKTTFMNILCWKVQYSSGMISISGQNTKISEYKKLIGYVPQEDIMLRELSVYDKIYHSARVRLPRSWSSSEIGRFVDLIIIALDLESVRDAVIGNMLECGISGGQRKRVNIAIELASCPICIFLDEPTSGLDSSSALQVTEILRQISKLGITVVSVIHQPRIEIFEQFDNCLMMAPGGKMIYLGPAKGAFDYFSGLGYDFKISSNPADILMDIVTGQLASKNTAINIDTMAQVWATHKVEDYVDAKNSNEFHNNALELIKAKKSSILDQIIACHNRSVNQQMRTPNSLFLEIFCGVAAGSIMGVAITSDEISDLYVGAVVQPLTYISVRTIEWLVPQMGFMVGIAANLAAAPAGVKLFAEERHVYFREAASGHSKIAYFIGCNLACLYRMTISCLHYAAAYHLIARPLAGWGYQFLMAFSLYFGIYGTSAIVAMLVKRENASLMALVVGLFMAATSGYAVQFETMKKIGLRWFFDLLYTRWFAEALCIFVLQ